MTPAPACAPSTRRTLARLAAFDHLEGYGERAGRGRAWDSFWSAWDAFAGADFYQATIERAIAYGNDTDTTATIAGGLAGIHWGVDAHPARVARRDAWPRGRGPTRGSAARPARVADLDDEPDAGRLGVDGTRAGTSATCLVASA